MGYIVRMAAAAVLAEEVRHLQTFIKIKPRVTGGFVCIAWDFVGAR